ncbi:MAG: 16S rRNA (guanine(527)-N(7))-methyltransferase RsmG [Pseudomonadota bacterium]
MSQDVRLAKALEILGLEAGPEARRGLLAYLALLGKWNRTYNLTAIDDPEKMFTHHLLDSLAVAPHVDADRLLDVGAGAGLPGIPLAILHPGLAVTTLDASEKKCSFMRQVAIELRLASLEVIHGRVERYQPALPFPCIVSRAFSDLAEFVALTRHLLAPGGRWLAMKGVLPREEMARLEGVRVVDCLPLAVPELDAERHLIIMEPA